MTLNPLNGFRSAADGEADKFDNLSRCVSVISENHRLIHEGMYYSAEHSFTGVTNGGVVNILLSVPANCYPHLQDVDVLNDSQDITIELYEGATTSNDGTPMVFYNRNRNSTNVPLTAIYHTPTVSAPGTQLDQRHYVNSGAKESFVSVTQGEWILKPSTKYLIRATNSSGGAAQIDIHLSIYEIDWRNAGK